jgi:uncharacterized protein YndB with AHSA1/START domain
MLDVKSQIAAVSRALGTEELESGPGRVLTIGQVYDTGIDDLWDVVTSPGRISRWFLPISGDLREGGRFQLEGNAGGTITRCDKPNSYAATWEFGGMVSWIEVTLTPSAGGTRFELRHLAPVDEAMAEMYGPGAVGLGWDGGLLGLANYVADRESAITPEEGLAWMATPDGKEFMRLAGDAWIDADIADGTDPAKARRLGDAVYAAYTTDPAQP